MSTALNQPSKVSKLLRARRFALMASVAGLGAVLLVAAPQFLPNQIPAIAHAEVAMRPASFADIVVKVKPAVFAVRVKVEDDDQQMSFSGGDQMPFPPGSPMERFFKRFGFGDMPNGRGGKSGQSHHFSMAQGSGFFITADGYGVTNNHVVERGQTVEIKTDNGKIYKAKVIGTDPRTDIALLKAEGGKDFPYVKFADKPPRIGDWVLAVGNPFGLGGTVTAGIVSASGRDIGAGPYDDFIQIDAPVNKGNSGGPTFDVDGNVIGVNTAIYSPSGGNVGIAFAIPADTVKSVVAQLKDKGVVTRGWIGVQIQPVTADIAESLGLKEAHGALVADAQSSGPAAKAGVESGDVVTTVNGAEVKDARDLAKKIGALAPNETVKLGLLRKGTEKTVSVTLGKFPDQKEAQVKGNDNGQNDDSGMPQLGLSLAPASAVAGANTDGVVVTEVDPNGPAAERGFKSGDVITEVAGRTVDRPSDVRKALDVARKEGKRTILMRVKTGDATRFVALPVGRA